MGMFDDLTAEQKISKAKVALMNDPDWRWLGSIMMLGNMSIDGGENARVPTAGTDGLNEVYNREYLADKTPEEMKFIVAHEALHKVFRHLFVWQNLFKEDPMLANIACDAVINNQYLKHKSGLKMVKHAVDFPKYEDADKWNARLVFEDLKKSGMSFKQMPQAGGGSGEDDEDGEGSAGHDFHDWESAKDMSDGEGKAAKEVEKQIDAALRQAAMAGNVGGGMPRHIKEMLVPSVDWRSLLSEFVKSRCAGQDKQTWRKPHKTYVAYDLYMPTPYSETVGKILIGGDTSGSIGDEMLSKFLGHMQVLCNEVNPDGIDIAWWDTKVAGVDEFSKSDMANLADAVKPKGGGGTDPSCVPAWIKKENKQDYVCAVMITDGEFYSDAVGDWGDLPVLWLVINEWRVPNIPVGVTVHVDNL